jgi:hypothetical protein
VVGRNLPAQAALFCNQRQMGDRATSVNRCPTGDGRRALWDHQLDAIAMLRDRLVGGRTIMGTINRNSKSIWRAMFSLMISDCVIVRGPGRLSRRVRVVVWRRR